MAFLAGWNRRKSKLVAGTTAGPQTNYPLRLTVYKSDGIDTNTDIYLGTNVRDDFGDVRFTTSDETTLLNYWIETLVSGTSATIWVKIDSIPASPSTVIIYIYYNNPTQTSLSSSPNTFYGADIEFASTSGWSEVDPISTMAITGGKLVATNLQRNVVAYTYTTNPMTDSLTTLVLEFSYKYTAGSNGTPQVYVGAAIANSLDSQANAIGARIDNPAGNGVYLAIRKASVLTYVLIHVLTATTLTKTWYIRIKLISGTSATFEAWLDNPTRSGAPDYSGSSGTAPVVAMTRVFGISGYLADSPQAFSSSAEVDNILVRKLATPEPAYGATGNEKSSSALEIGRDLFRSRGASISGGIMCGLGKRK